MAISPDGERFARVSTDGLTLFVFAANGQLLQQVLSPEQRIVRAVFSNDGGQLALLCLERVFCYDSWSGHCLCECEFGAECAAFSADGLSLLVGSSGGTVAIIDHTGRLRDVCTLEHDRLTDAQWGPETGQIAVVSYDDLERRADEMVNGIAPCQFWSTVVDIARGEVVHQVVSPRRSLHHLRLSANGCRICTLSGHGYEVFDAITGERLLQVDFVGPDIVACLSDDGQLLCTCQQSVDSQDFQVVTWDIDQGTSTDTAAPFRPCGCRLLGGGMGLAIVGRLESQVWNIATPGDAVLFRGSHEFYWLQWSREGTKVFAGQHVAFREEAGVERLLMWSPGSGDSVPFGELPGDPVVGSFCADALPLFETDGTVSVYDLRSTPPAPLGSFRAFESIKDDAPELHVEGIFDIFADEMTLVGGFSTAEGTIIASTNSPNWIDRVASDSESPETELRGFFIPDAGEDAADVHVKIFDVAGSRYAALDQFSLETDFEFPALELVDLDTQTQSSFTGDQIGPRVLAAQFAADGNSLVILSNTDNDESQVELINTAFDQGVIRASAPDVEYWSEPILDVADATQLIAIGSKAGSVHLLDLTTLDCVAVWSGHIGPVTAVAFSPNGDRLATASSDGTMLIWDLTSLTEPNR